MSNLISKFSILLISIAIFSSITMGQEKVGKIFTKQQADQIYGKVTKSVEISTENLKKLLNYTQDKVMFRIENNKIIILGDERASLLSEDKAVDSDKIFFMFSKSQVLEMLNMGKAGTTTAQMRNNVFTLENGDTVLEIAYPCPPYCD